MLRLVHYAYRLSPRDTVAVLAARVAVALLLVAVPVLAGQAIGRLPEALARGVDRPLVLSVAGLVIAFLFAQVALVAAEVPLADLLVSWVRGLTLAQVARETGVSAGTIKRFEGFAMSGPTERAFHYEPWGAEYLERWLDGTLTPDIRVWHDLQRILDRDPVLSRRQIQEILPRFYEIYERVRERKS
jgi:hypothetical protein